MQSADLHAVHDLDRRCFPIPWSYQTFRNELLKNPASHLWVAETNGFDPPRILGALVIWLILDEAHIGTLSVHPQHRRQGIASSLLATGLEHMAALGARSATLEVRRSNVAAQNLYERHGFQVVGQRKGYYLDNREDALIMTLPALDGGGLRSPSSPRSAA